MNERTGPYSRQREKIFANFGLAKFSFPELDLSNQILPDLDKEIIWLRQHVEEGSLDKTILTQKAHTVYIDTRVCPPFLYPYDNDDHFLEEVIAQLRETGKIPQKLEDWGKDTVELVLPKTSRFGISVPEIEELVIPAVKQQLSLDSLAVRLPTVNELLYLRFRFGIFPDQAIDYAQQTREWTSTSYLGQHGEELGNLFVSGRRKDLLSGGVRWWFRAGVNNRLPSIGFRLVIEPRK